MRFEIVILGCYLINYRNLYNVFYGYLECLLI